MTPWRNTTRAVKAPTGSTFTTRVTQRCPGRSCFLRGAPVHLMPGSSFCFFSVGSAQSALQPHSIGADVPGGGCACCARRATCRAFAARSRLVSLACDRCLLLLLSEDVALDVSSWSVNVCALGSCYRMGIRSRGLSVGPFASWSSGIRAQPPVHLQIARTRELPVGSSVAFAARLRSWTAGGGASCT